MERPRDDNQPDQTGSKVTQLLGQAAEGDTSAAGQLLPLVYDQLRPPQPADGFRKVGGQAGSFIYQVKPNRFWIVSSMLSNRPSLPEIEMRTYYRVSDEDAPASESSDELN